MSYSAIRNQRVMSRAQANFDAMQPPEYYAKGPVDEVEEDATEEE